jgi:SAM-dependent methyltransferase
MMGDPDWYDANAHLFLNRTRGLPVSPHLARFRDRLPREAFVLHAGCGSGRDAEALVRLGVRVIAIDRSSAMVSGARALGVDARRMTFDDLPWRDTFDGIWAMASLLHMPLADLPGTVAALGRALKPGGLFFCCFKLGQGERIAEDGRPYTDLDPAGLDWLVTSAGLIMEEMTIDAPIASWQAGTKWVSAFSRKHR